MTTNANVRTEAELEAKNLQLAIKIAQHLTDEFDTRPCIVIKGQSMFAHYQPSWNGNGAIIMSRRALAKDEHIVEMIVLHEFAHHLVYTRQRLMRYAEQCRKAARGCTKALRTWKFGYKQQEQQLHSTKYVGREETEKANGE